MALNIVAADIKGRLIFDRNQNGLFFRDETDYLAKGINLSSGLFIAQGFTVISMNDGTGDYILHDNTPPVSLPAAVPPPDIELNSSNMSGNLCVIPTLTGGDGTPLRNYYKVAYFVYLQEMDVNDAVLNTLTIQIELNYQYSLDNEFHSCLEAQVNCGAPAVQTKDFSKFGIYATSITYDHSLYPPPSANTAKIEHSNSDTVTYTEQVDRIAQGGWSARSEATVVYVQADGLEIIKTWVTTLQFKVSCDNSFNTIGCCLDKIEIIYEDFKTSGRLQEAEDYLRRVYAPTHRHVTWYFMALWKGDENMQVKYLNKIKQISGCGDGCGGCGEKGAQFVVVPGSQAMPGTTTIVTSTNGTIDVVYSVQANSVTYNVELSQALLQQIQGKFNTTIQVDPASLSELQITLDPASTASNKIYNIKLLTGSSTVNQINTMDIEIVIAKNGTGPSPYYTVSREIKTRRGLLFWANPSVTFGTNQPNLATDFAVIKIVDIFSPVPVDAPKFDVIPTIQRTVDVEDYTDTSNVKVECYYTDRLLANSHSTGYITLRLVSPSGAPLQLQDLNTLINTLIIACKITYPST